METFVVPSAKLNEWLLSLLNGFEVYLPVFTEKKNHFKKFERKDFESSEKRPILALEKIRITESMKGFFFAPREIVAAGFESPLVKDKSKRLIVGAKNCDLMPMKVHEKIFLEGNYIDPFYKDRLERTTIISADCPVPESTCFCNLLGLTPYPISGSDINLTVLRDGYLLEPFTDKGKELIASTPNLFRNAREEEITQRDELRQRAIQILKEINPKEWRKDLAKGVEQATKDEFWQEQAKTCVECFGCLMICPTCYCYLLYDQAKSKQDFERTKIWDACYYAAYARVGGGMNPRVEFLQRFKNRFHCKFMNFNFDHGFSACSGCGRCLAVCSGKIDIRKVLGNI